MRAYWKVRGVVESASLAEFVHSSITYEAQEANGIAETAGRHAELSSQMLGRLLEHLATNGVLSAADLITIVQPYRVVFAAEEPSSSELP